MKIQYNQVERIISDRLILFEGKVYETEEDMKRFPKTITLISAMEKETFDMLKDQLERALGG